MPAGEALGPAAICGTVVSGGGALAVGPPGPGVRVAAVLCDALADGWTDGWAEAESDTEADGAADGDAPGESAGEGSEVGEPAATASPPQPGEPPRDRTGAPFSVSAPSARSG